MPDSLFTTLVGMLDHRSLSAIAGALGESEQSIWRGTESSIAAVLGGLAQRSSDPDALRKILDVVPKTLGEVVTGPQVASSVADPNSPLLSVGKRLMSGLFGTSESENAVTSALSAHSGLRPGVTSTLMAMVAPMVISFISRRVRDEGTTMSGLGSLLQGEAAAVRNALPADLYDRFWPRASMASPVITQQVEKERSSTNWLPLLALAALIPALFWLFNHQRRPTTPIAPVPTGEASRVATPTSNLVCTLPAGVTLPDRSIEAGFLAFVQNPDTKPVATDWFTFDKLDFDSGSATLRPQSQAQLDNIAVILANCPTVHLKVAGYTDNVGGVEPNLRLSRSRANSVVALLVRKGVSRDRLVAEGYGEENPIADNSTADGRAKNRRIAMGVTQK